MAHLEDKPMQTVILDQLQDLFRQSFIMAERAVAESAKRIGLNESETKDILIANSLPIGMEFLKQITNVAQAIENASPKQLDKMIESIDLVLQDVRRRNKVE